MSRIITTNGDRRPLRRNAPASAEILDRLPPHSIEAEQGVLGCCLLAGDSMTECVEKLRGPEVFYDLRHQHLYSACLKMYEAREAIDTLTVRQHLQDAGQLDAAGGLAYLASLPDAVPSAANLAQYLEIVREKYLLRRMLSACSSAVTRIYQHTGEVDALLDGVERDLLSVNEARVQANEVRLGVVLQDVMDRIENYRRGGPQMQGLPTGFDYLDKMLLGLGPGDLDVIAARPGLGKTSIGIQIIAHLAVEKKIPCAVFTLEMTAEQLTARLLFQQAKGDFQRYRSGFFENKDMPALMDAGAALARAQIYLDETAGITVLQLRARARRLHHQHGIGCLLVDYIGLMRPSRSFATREQEVAEMSGGLKALAKELKIPVIVLAQLNREIEKGGKRKPQLADLRESGAIEQDADVVGFLYEPKLTKEQQADQESRGQDWSDHCRAVNLLVAKQRNGPTGDCKLLYQKKSMRFESLYTGNTNGDPGADASTGENEES